MASSLDMSLDDIIKKRKRTQISNNDFSQHTAQTSFQRPSYHPNIAGITTPYSIPTPMPEPEPRYASNSQGGTKLYLSNLDYGVSNKDIMILFSEVGEVKRYAIHYDKSGRSKGTAEVVFVRQSDALKAMRRYNNLSLDGMPMKIEVVGVDSVVPNSSQIIRSPEGSFSRGQAGYNPEAVRDGYRHTRGRGQGRGLYENRIVTAKELDAELEDYRRTAK